MVQEGIKCNCKCFNCQISRDKLKIMIILSTDQQCVHCWYRKKEVVIVFSKKNYTQIVKKATAKLCQ